jgi:serine/threonine protein kinase
MQTTSLSAGTLLRQRYYILDKLGEGGFGAVYKARDEDQSGLLVAIKQINMGKSLSVQEKIEVTDSYNREVSLLSALRHKNLPCIYDHFTDPEHWYLVMQYLEGCTLEQSRHTLSQGRWPVHEVLSIGIKLCSVLDFLHQQKPPIIFRDVKPDNILQTPGGDLYVIDFGIARRYRAGQARDTGALGSPGYAAPEQYGHARTTPQTDIYGLGATLQTLLAGKDPVELKVAGEAADAFIPAGLHALLQWMMEPDPGKRPESMEVVQWHLGEMERDRQKVSSWDRLNAVTGEPGKPSDRSEFYTGLAAQQDPHSSRGSQPAPLKQRALPLTTWTDSTISTMPPPPGRVAPVLNRLFSFWGHTSFWDIFRPTFKVFWWGIWLCFILAISLLLIASQFHPPSTNWFGIIVIGFVLNVILSVILSLILAPCLYFISGLVRLCWHGICWQQRRRKQGMQASVTPLQQQQARKHP